MLTSYNGNAITYDGSGNPLSMDGWSFTWQGGRQLAGMTNGTTTLSFAYNDSGLRTSKTVGNTTHTYTYQSSTLIADVTATDAMYFHYDQNGSVIGFTYDDGTTTAEYYYVKNLQGDVLGILDSSGNLVASYTYDAWGNILIVDGSNSALANRNPIRYRGYYFDQETDLYYLQSRYYSPEIGRWINADGYVSTGQGFVGNNMFAYCGNNPVIRVDDNGQYYTSGQIHDFVINDICKTSYSKIGSRKENKIIYSILGLFSTYGYCDLHDSVTGEVWELKRFSNAYSCQFAVAYAQLSNYVNGKLEKNPGLKLEYGGTYTNISPNVFTKPDIDGEGKYVIGYWDTGVGVLYYEYVYIPSGSEVAVAVATVAMAALAGYAFGAGAAAGLLIPA